MDCEQEIESTEKQIAMARWPAARLSLFAARGLDE